MTMWKRSRVVYLAVEDEQVFRLKDLLEGRIEPSLRGKLCLFDLLNGRRIPIAADLLEFLLAVPSDGWVDPNELSRELPADQWPASEAVQQLVESGCLLTQGDSEPERRGRALDTGYAEALWHPDALFFHRMARLQVDEATGEFSEFDIDSVASRSGSLAQAFVEQHGAPPPARFDPETDSAPVDLPPAHAEGEIFDLLRRRRTVRAFDAARPVAQADLSTLLRYTFGRLGEVELSPDLKLFKKGSPSGGALHPLEAFPLVLNVDGFEPGLYHYNTERHHLKPLMEPMSRQDARELAQRIGARQLYVGEAGVLILLVARFLRNHWKYRRQSRTYGVMLMDAGHLSQTFYLLATQLGLGAFFSAAIDVEMVEQTLPLAPESFGPLAICGCGHLDSSGRLHNQGGLDFK